MSFEIKKVYTDNPYVDEMVYYTKLMGLNTVLKLKDLADNSETLESLKMGGLYISCVENTASFEEFDKVSVTALASAGITDPVTVARCLSNKADVPVAKRKLVTKALMKEYIESYDEKNNYYRMLHGMPNVGMADYVTDWVPPDGLIIDLSKPIHEMDNAEASILDKYGVLDQMMEEDPEHRQYMRFLGKKRIDYYLARRAGRFDILYIPDIDSEAIYKMYRDKLDENKWFTLRTVYSDAFKHGSDYYDSFIAVFIILITEIDIISRVQEFIARKEIFDIRSVQYIFKSYGVPFFEEIPLRFQIAMVKNLHTLLKYKSTARCMVEICSLFGFDNVEVFKYYMLKDRNVNLENGDYKYSLDENGEEILGDEFTLKFLKMPLEGDLDDYIRSSRNYMDYDELVELDSKWDGGLDHDYIIGEILKEDFNFTRTKYMSVESTYDIAKKSAQLSYFYNMLYDNVELESLITVRIPFIDPTREFKVADVFTLLTVLTHYYNGTKDMIMDTQSKVLYVNGFNFKADLAKLAELIAPKIDSGMVMWGGSTLHAREQLEKFIIPKASIPSFNEMMDIFINNMEVRDELIKGMYEADDMKVYFPYRMLYDALMTVQLTMDYFKDPETGDFYRDEEGDATYTEFLKHRDSALYLVILQLDDYDDDTSRNQFIANVIDSIIYALEEFIDSKEFSALFSNLPIMSVEAVKQYIASVINFYKSYKVDFLGVNTTYYIDDKNEGVIKLVDRMDFNRYFERDEYLQLREKIVNCLLHYDHKEYIELKERLYFDIYTWATWKFNDGVTAHEHIASLISKLVFHTVIEFLEKRYEACSSFRFGDNINPTSEFDGITSIFTMDEKQSDRSIIADRLWIYYENETHSPYLSKLPGYEGSLVLSDVKGDSSPGPLIAKTIDPSGNRKNVPTEKAIEDYAKLVSVTVDDLTQHVLDKPAPHPSSELIITEKAWLEAITVKML